MKGGKIRKLSEQKGSFWADKEGNARWKNIAGIALIVIILLSLVSSYYALAGASVNVDTQWAQVQVDLQRRFDLIPRVVNATKLYINYEKGLLEDITRLRSQWATAQSQGTDQQIQTANQFETTISRLLLVVENYPNLQAIQAVHELIVELEGTENRIAIQRMNYNNAVRDYNMLVQATFPTSLLAPIFGFHPRPYFEGVSGSENPPPVNIST